MPDRPAPEETAPPPASTLVAAAAARLAALQGAGLHRTLAPGSHGPGLTVRRGGRSLIDFCSNDYLGLAHDPEVKAAAMAAVDRYGAGAGASRLVTGNYALLDELESELAAWKGAGAAIVFGSGYLANLGTVPALTGAGDAVFADQLAHACLMSGARLSGADTHVFRHNDMGHLAVLLARHRARVRHALILTDGVFSMDGDLAPLPDLLALAARFDAWVMTDDAHGLGVLGGGRGSAAHWGAAPPLQMGTLSKAAGAYGGYVCAPPEVVDLLRNRARSFVYATALPPAAAGAALKALEIMRRDPGRCARPLQLARRFAHACGLPAPASPIVPVLLGTPERALAASASLEQAGFLVTAIRPPTVPPGTARLRITFSAAHDEADVDRLATALQAAGAP